MDSPPPFFRASRALAGLAVGTATVEAVLLLIFDGELVGLAAHVAAPPPFGVFHDLRWLLVFHPSWLAFVAEVAAAIAIRGAFIALAVRLAWPAGQSPPPFGVLWRRGAVFTAGAGLLFAPWAGFLFALAVTPVSWLFLAGVIPVLVLGAVIHRGAIAGHWWRRPTLRTAGWVVLTFVVLSLGGAAATLAPGWLALLPVALTALFDAWAWHSIVHSVVVGDPVPGRFPVVPVAVAVLLLVFLGVSILVFDVVTGGSPSGPLEDDDAGSDPVLVATGFSSSWDGRQLDLLAPPYDEVQFSYRGHDSEGRPLSYTAADTHQPLPVLARLMAEQVEQVHQRTGRDVTVIAQSEGSLVARVFAAASDLEHVDRILLLSPLVEPAGVYYPAGGEDGWGVASGWLLRGVTEVVASVSPYEAGPDLPFVRSVVDHAPVLRTLPSCPIPGPESSMLVPLDTALALPPGADPDIPFQVVPAFHAGFLQAGSENATVRAVLEGRDPPRARLWSASNFFGSALASGWHVPQLPLTLPGDWQAELERVAGPDGSPSCERLPDLVREWVPPTGG